MSEKIYRLTGIDTAMALIRPGASWEISNTMITRWDDPRPCPTMEEIKEVQKLAKEFEDKINTIWLAEQVKEIQEHRDTIERAMNE